MMGGFGDIFKGIFGSTQDTQTQQTGTSNQTTQNNAVNDPRLQALFGQLFGGTQSAVQTNPIQTQAATQLINAGQYALPAFNAASNLSGTGIGDPSRYMPQYTQNVVDATQAQFDNTNARSLAGQQASTAKAGALGGTQRAVGRAIAEGQLAATQKPVIAGLYNQGYQTSVDTAAKDAALRAQGASTTAGILGAYTGAGTAASNAASGLTDVGFRNAMLPYQQQASFLPSFLGAYGTNSNTQSSGTTNSSTTKTDSPFDIGMDLLGGAMSLGMFSDERVKHDIKPVGKTFDGMPIYTYKYNGDESGRTHMGLMAQDVEQEKPHAVGSYNGIKTVDYDKATRAAGGGVGHGRKAPKEFHEKVTDAFRAITEMKRASGGGVLPRYDDGGFVQPIANDPGVNYDSNWTPVVEKAPQTSGFQDWLKNRSDARAQNKGQGNDMSGAISNNEKMMSSFMSNMTPRADGGYVPQGHRDGNPVWSNEGMLDFGGNDDGVMSFAGFKGLSPDSPVGRPYSAPDDERAPESGGFFSGLSSFLPSVKREGVITGDKITPDQSIGAIISGMGRGRYRDSVLALSNNRFKELEAEREAGRLLGNYQGKPTMDAQRLALEKAGKLGVIDGNQTVELQRLREEQARARVPSFTETGNVTAAGTPEKAFVNPWNAPPSAQHPLPNPGSYAPANPSGTTAARPPASSAPDNSQSPQRTPNGTPGTTETNPVWVPNQAAEIELLRTAPGTYYKRTWKPDDPVKRSPDNPMAPGMSTSPPPSAPGPVAQSQPPSTPAQPPPQVSNLPARIQPTAPPPGGPPQDPVQQQGPLAGQAQPAPQFAPGEQPPQWGTQPSPGITPVPTGTMPFDPNLTGPEVLKAVPPALATKAQRMLMGLDAPPTGRAAMDPTYRMALHVAQQVEPGFDSNRWKIRNEMQKAYAPSGKIGNAIISAEKAINHLYEMDEAAKKLGNSDVFMGRFWREHVGAPLARNMQSGPDSFSARENEYLTKADTATKEVIKFLTQTGGGVEERAAMLNRFSSVKNYADLRAAVKAQVDLMKGQIKPFVAAWNREMVEPFGKPPIAEDGLFNDPTTRARMHELEAQENSNPSAPVTIKTDEEFAKLKSGTMYIGPDGKTRKKP
jgi:hypothetical protein